MNDVQQILVNSVRNMSDEKLLALALSQVGAAPQSAEVTPLRAPVAKPAESGERSAPKRGARKATSVAKESTPGAPKPSKAGRKPAGEKRGSEVIEGHMEKILEAIASNPGRGSEQLQRELNLTKKEITLPIRKLLEAGKIRSEGQKRATRYFQA